VESRFYGLSVAIRGTAAWPRNGHKVFTFVWLCVLLFLACVCDLFLFDQAERWRAVSMAEVWLSAARQRGLEMDTKALLDDSVAGDEPQRARARAQLAELERLALEASARARAAILGPEEEDMYIEGSHAGRDSALHARYKSLPLSLYIDI